MKRHWLLHTHTDSIHTQAHNIMYACIHAHTPCRSHTNTGRDFGSHHTNVGRPTHGQVHSPQPNTHILSPICPPIHTNTLLTISLPKLSSRLTSALSAARGAELCPSSSPSPSVADEGPLSRKRERLDWAEEVRDTGRAARRGRGKGGLAQHTNVMTVYTFPTSLYMHTAHTKLQVQASTHGTCTLTHMHKPNMHRHTHTHMHSHHTTPPHTHTTRRHTTNPRTTHSTTCTRTHLSPRPPSLPLVVDLHCLPLPLHSQMGPAVVLPAPPWWEG